MRNAITCLSLLPSSNIQKKIARHNNRDNMPLLWQNNQGNIQKKIASSPPCRDNTLSSHACIIQKKIAREVDGATSADCNYFILLHNSKENSKYCFFNFSAILYACWHNSKENSKPSLRGRCQASSLLRIIQKKIASKILYERVPEIFSIEKA